ncbi:hypothetical protein Pelo_18550 [Pelomyxa schiedti]|nr:hypothetical protein Pelo_18550 [Pelomyxa schiedti]
MYACCQWVPEMQVDFKTTEILSNFIAWRIYVNPSFTASIHSEVEIGFEANQYAQFNQNIGVPHSIHFGRVPQTCIVSIPALGRTLTGGYDDDYACCQCFGNFRFNAANSSQPPQPPPLRILCKQKVMGKKYRKYIETSNFTNN